MSVLADVVPGVFWELGDCCRTRSGRLMLPHDFFSISFCKCEREIPATGPWPAFVADFLLVCLMSVNGAVKFEFFRWLAELLVDWCPRLSPLIRGDADIRVGVLEVELFVVKEP